MTNVDMVILLKEALKFYVLLCVNSAPKQKIVHYVHVHVFLYIAAKHIFAR
jgi:hypothetical protein